MSAELEQAVLDLAREINAAIYEHEQLHDEPPASEVVARALVAAGWLPPGSTQMSHQEFAELIVERERAAEQRGARALVVDLIDPDLMLDPDERERRVGLWIARQFARRLARGSQTAPSATESAETGGGA